MKKTGTLSDLFRVSNWPFGLKFALPAGLSLLVIGLVTYLSITALLSQSRDLEQIAEKDLTATTTLGQLAQKVHDTNGELFRQMSFQAAEISEFGNPVENVAELGGQIDQIKQTLIDFRDNKANGDSVARIDAIIKELDTYKGSIDVVAAMMEIDFASAVATVLPFDANYRNMVSAIDELVEGTVSGSRQRAQAAQKSASAANRNLLLAAAIAFAVSALTALLVGLTTTSSIKHIALATGSLASGNQDVDIANLERKDELGAVVDSLRTFQANLAEKARLDAERKSEEERKERRAEKIESLIGTFEQGISDAIDTLQGSSDRLAEVSQAMNGLAQDTKAKASASQSSSESLANNVQAVASAAEEMTASLREVTDQISNATSSARGAVEETQKASRVVTELSDAANQIGEVISLIQDIASQTNLLALNATIEAARAGEAGKGFAVVASEVKGLANQTATATGEIAQRIEVIQSAVSQMVGAIDAVTASITVVDQIASSIASAAEEQSSTTVEIAQNASHAASGTQDVSDIISEVSASADESEGRSREVLKASTDLKGATGNLRTDIRTFLDDIKLA